MMGFCDGGYKRKHNAYIFQVFPQVLKFKYKPFSKGKAFLPHSFSIHVQMTGADN